MHICGWYDADEPRPDLNIGLYIDGEVADDDFEVSYAGAGTGPPAATAIAAGAVSPTDHVCAHLDSGRP